MLLPSLLSNTVDVKKGRIGCVMIVPITTSAIVNMLELRAELVRMREESPDLFNYKSVYKPCGCVIPVHSRLFGNDEMMDNLGISFDEEGFLVGLHNMVDRCSKIFTDMTDEEAKGVAGLTEAIRRVDVIMSRYGVTV
jgi:hypothetical protein